MSGPTGRLEGLLERIRQRRADARPGQGGPKPADAVLGASDARAGAAATSTGEPSPAQVPPSRPAAEPAGTGGVPAAASEPGGLEGASAAASQPAGVEGASAASEPADTDEALAMAEPADTDEVLAMTPSDLPPEASAESAQADGASEQQAAPRRAQPTPLETAIEGQLERPGSSEPPAEASSTAAEAPGEVREPAPAAEAKSPRQEEPAVDVDIGGGFTDTEPQDTERPAAPAREAAPEPSASHAGSPEAPAEMAGEPQRIEARRSVSPSAPIARKTGEAPTAVPPTFGVLVERTLSLRLRDSS